MLGINQDGTHLGLTCNINNITIRWGQNTIPNGNPDVALTGAGIDVFLTGTGNSTSLSDCVITENTNVNSWGGGINVDSGTSGLPGDPGPDTTNRSTVTFTRCTVTNNKAKLDGAGINLYTDIHNVTLSDCVVTGPSKAGYKRSWVESGKAGDDSGSGEAATSPTPVRIICPSCCQRDTKAASCRPALTEAASASLMTCPHNVWL